VTLGLVLAPDLTRQDFSPLVYAAPGQSITFVFEACATSAWSTPSPAG